MMYRTHAVIGATFAGALMLILKQPLMPLGIALAAFGALLPDLDHPDSKISNLNPLMVVLSFIGRIILTILSLVYNLFIGVLGVIGIHPEEANDHHRGPFTHSPVALVLFGLAFLPLLIFGGKWWYISLMTGIFSHLWADSLNPMGIKWFWPVTKRPWTVFGPADWMTSKMLTVSTGMDSIGETIVFFLAIASLMGVVLMGSYGQGVSFQDAAKIYPPAAAIKVSLGGGTGSSDVALPVGELPKDVMRMPDGTLYFADGTPVSPEELVKRNIVIKGYDTKGLQEKGKDAGKGLLDGFQPVLDLIRGASQGNPASPGQ